MSEISAFVVYRVDDNQATIVRVCWTLSTARAAVSLLKMQYPDGNYNYSVCAVDKMPDVIKPLA